MGNHALHNLDESLLFDGAFFPLPEPPGNPFDESEIDIKLKKYITFPERELEVVVQGEEVVVTAERPVKGLVFLNGVDWSDNYPDVIPDNE